MSSSDIPLVDLRAQHDSLRSEVAAAIARVLERQLFIAGPEVDAFEREFASFSGVAEAVAVSNGTTALELALRALDVGHGDEVITVSQTFFATTEAIVNVGATPVFIDVDPDDWTMAPEHVEAAVTARTKVLLPVHLYGHPADVPALAQAAPGIPIVEDAAQAHGARYHDRPVGTASAAACFSFFPSKNLGAYGDAGAVVTQSPELAERVRSLRDHGRSSKYEHDRIGTNARIDELQAAVLRTKLPHLRDWNDRRRDLARHYEERLVSPLLRLQTVQPWAQHVRHLFVVSHPERDRLLDVLRRDGIGAGVHYPVPAHRQEALRHVPWSAPAPLPVTEMLAETVLSLPIYPELSFESVDRVVSSIERATAAAA